jgi:hypothetical protein
MPLVTDVAYASTNSTLVTDDAWVSLVGGPLPVVGLGFVVQLQGYVLGLSEDSSVRFVIDGTEVVKAPPEFPLTYMQLLTIGPHTVDYQARVTEDEEQEQAGPRGFSVVDLGPDLVLP